MLLLQAWRRRRGAMQQLLALGCENGCGLAAAAVALHNAALRRLKPR
jgi:hypothetical protein